ncbi:MAG: DUF2147 domain-containing protein [Sphingomonadales bacterium]|nr:MAG: DUF2147 domain-containing protein [Sphingomonadales bacterium]
MEVILIRLFSLLAAATFLVAAAPAPMSDPNGLEGDWRNTKDTVHLRVSRCGPSYCGKVTWAGEQQRADARKGSGKDLVGSTLLRDLRPSGSATWRGKIYVPDININVTATVVQLSPIKLRVSGCSWLNVVCRTQHWHRIA